MNEDELKFGKKAIQQMAELGGENTMLALEYIKLFSSKDKPLSFEQTFMILADTANFWLDYPADIWKASVLQLLALKRTNVLELPLQNHEELFKWIDFITERQKENPQEKQNHISSPPPLLSADATTKKDKTEEDKEFGRQCIEQMRQTINQAKRLK